MPKEAIERIDRMLLRLLPPPVHPLTGKPVKYAIPASLDPHAFCLECGLWKPNGFCKECEPGKWAVAEMEEAQIGGAA